MDYNAISNRNSSGVLNHNSSNNGYNNSFSTPPTTIPNQFTTLNLNSLNLCLTNTSANSTISSTASHALIRGNRNTF